MKKFFALFLVAALALSVFACSPASKEEDVDNNGYKDTVIISLGGMLDTADPYGSTGAECQMFSNMTHLLLTYNNSDTGKLEGITAEAWKDVDGDGKNWQITLKKGVIFHNGEEMKASDVKFTWEYCSSDAHNVVKPLSAATYVASYEIVDDYNLIFHLKSAMFDFPTYLDTKIYSQKAFQTMDAAEAAKVGNGPYMYDESLYQAGVQYGFTRFENYYEGTANYPTLHLVIKNIAEEDARAAALQNGEIDICWMDTPAFFNVLSNDSNCKTYSRKGAQSYYVGWNWTSSAVNNLKLRQAIAKAINKDDIVSVAFENGIGGSANSNFCVPSGLGYAEVKSTEYDVEGAKALLKELGYENGLTLKLVHYAGLKKVAEVLQANLKAIGITLEIEQVDGTNWSAFKNGREGFDLFLDYCSYKGALLYNYNRFFQKNGSSNATGYYNEEFETLLQNVLNAPSYDQMLVEFKVMQQFVADDLSVIPFATNNMIGASRAEVENYVMADTTNWMNFSTVCVPIK